MGCYIEIKRKDPVYLVKGTKEALVSLEFAVYFMHRKRATSSLIWGEEISKALIIISLWENENVWENAIMKFCGFQWIRNHLNLHIIDINWIRIGKYKNWSQGFAGIFLVFITKSITKQYGAPSTCPSFVNLVQISCIGGTLQEINDQIFNSF